jgi:UDP-N-acetylglucosamine 2-epimerase (non-hydrolysing)
MIDTLLRHRAKASESTILQDLQLAKHEGAKPYAILTLHRPTNVDDERVFSRMLHAFLEISKRMPVIFPAHPRTLKRIQELDLGDYFVDHFVQGPEPWDSRVRIRLIPPLGYLDFLHLMSNAKVVLTDSGGVQEETTILGVPCITLRENTERPVTVDQGSNVLVGSSPDNIVREFNRVHREGCGPQRSPRYWDGNAAGRIIKIIVNDFLSGRSTLNPAEDTKLAELRQT